MRIPINGNIEFHPNFKNGTSLRFHLKSRAVVARRARRVSPDLDLPGGSRRPLVKVEESLKSALVARIDRDNPLELARCLCWLLRSACQPQPGIFIARIKLRCLC